MARYRSARKFFGIKSECLETAGSKFGELISLANSSTRAKNSWLISLQYVRRIFRSLPRRFVSSSSQLPPKEQTYRAIVIEYLFTRRASCSFHGGTKKTREKQLYRRAHFLIVFTREEPIERTGQKGESPFPFPVFLISMPRVVVFRARDDTETMAGLGATRVPWILITFPSLDSSETRPPSKSCPSRPSVIYVIIFRDNGTRVIRIRYLFSLTRCQRMTYWSS